MPQPFNYTLNAQDPTQNLLRTVAAGQGISQMQAQRAKTERAAVLQEQLQTDLGQLGENPTPAALSKVMVKYPHLSEQFKRTYDVLSTEQQKAQVNQASQVYAALDAGNPTMAQDLLTTQAAAARNSGLEQEAKAAETMAELIKLHPETAKTSAGLFLASSMGPEEFTETFTKLQSERREAALQPSELTKAQAEARSAADKAQFAESEAAADLQKKGWDIYKIQEDVKIAKENNRIAVLKATMEREKNDLKKQELKLKLDEFKEKRNQVVRDKVADVESANSNIDNMLTTVDRILKTPIGVIEDATGPIESRLMTVQQDVADFEVLLENADAQAFLSQIPNLKGLGSLSDAEGKKITSALQNFSLRQSPRQLVANMREAQRLLLKMRTNTADRYGLPETIPDTPQAETAPEDVEALILKYTTPGTQ